MTAHLTMWGNTETFMVTTPEQELQEAVQSLVEEQGGGRSLEDSLNSWMMAKEKEQTRHENWDQRKQGEEAAAVAMNHGPEVNEAQSLENIIGEVQNEDILEAVLKEKCIMTFRPRARSCVEEENMKRKRLREEDSYYSFLTLAAMRKRRKSNMEPKMVEDGAVGKARGRG